MCRRHGCFYAHNLSELRIGVRHQAERYEAGRFCRYIGQPLSSYAEKAILWYFEYEQKHKIVSPPWAHGYVWAVRNFHIAYRSDLGDFGLRRDYEEWLATGNQYVSYRFVFPSWLVEKLAARQNYFRVRHTDPEYIRLCRVEADLKRRLHDATTRVTIATQTESPHCAAMKCTKVADPATIPTGGANMEIPSNEQTTPPSIASTASPDQTSIQASGTMKASNGDEATIVAMAETMSSTSTAGASAARATAVGGQNIAPEVPITSPTTAVEGEDRIVKETITPPTASQEPAILDPDPPMEDVPMIDHCMPKMDTSMSSPGRTRSYKKHNKIGGSSKA